MKRPKQFFLTICLTTALPILLLSQHFVPVTGGFNPMFFTINKALHEGIDLISGDEIGIFDGTLCVGAGILTGPLPDDPPFVISCLQDDGTGSNNGFTSGNPIIFKIWDASASTEYTFAVPTYQPGSNTVFTGLGSANVSLFCAISGTKWTGGTGNAWGTSGNWSNGVPGSTTTVVVPTGLTNYPTLTASGSCKNILLQADATGMASILGNNNLTVSGNSYIETYISADQWHTVSSSCGSQTAGIFYLNGNPKVFIALFDESLNDYTYIENTSTALADMTGYMLWVNSEPGSNGKIFTYIGNMNDGSFGSSGNMLHDDQGWNMVGNPYPSAIDWDAASGWTKSNLDNAIYIINNGTWASYILGTGANGGSRYIAQGQGFFVKVTSSGTGTLQMNNSVRLHNSVGFLKAETYDELVKLAVTGNDLTDETVIRFKEGTSDIFDSEFDAYKRFSTIEKYPQVYTYNDIEYSINSLSATESIDLGFTCGVDGQYTFSVNELNNIENLWLEDSKLGSITNLIEDDYTFEYQTSDASERFILHFTALSVHENILDDMITYTIRDQIHIKANKMITGKVELYNLLGQIVNSGDLIDGICKMSVGKNGYYLVKVVSGKSVSTKKVFVQ